ncbi:MAG: hypothetical protein AAF648_06950 [Pseudomonadota bacterium]
MDWNLTTLECDEVLGDAEQIIAKKDVLSFAVKDNRITVSTSNEKFRGVWESFAAVDVPADTIPEPDANSAMGFILIFAEPHPSGDAHVMLVQKLKDEKAPSGMAIFGWLVSIEHFKEHGAVPGPKSHNGYYHLPL